MANNIPTDADLVTKTLSGDREAFACLYDRYARLVRAVVYGVALDWPMVQDMTQECFLRAYKNLLRLHDPDRFGRWLVGIARQVARERKRTISRDRHRFVGGDEMETTVLPDTSNAIESAEEGEVILRRVAELPERERLAIQIFYLQGRDARRVGELLGLSRSGVYALLERTLAQLAALVRRHEVKKEAK